ncbi:MAG: hypothetical protein ABL932_11885, partial [Terricaulis sp.]
MAHIVALKQALDSGFTCREGAHDERAVGDGLIPWRSGTTLQWSGKSRLQTHGGTLVRKLKNLGGTKLLTGAPD